MLVTLWEAAVSAHSNSGLTQLRAVHVLYITARQRDWSSEHRWQDIECST